MKRIKHLLLGLIAVFALVASSRANEGITTNYDVLTISGTVTTNAPYTVKNNVTTYSVVTVKFATKDLLSLFASWAGTSWPAGAKLVQAWDEPWNGDVLVVDKTGTNVLFDASNDLYPTQYFTVDFFSGEGAYTETDNENNPGFYNYTWFNNGSFTLVDGTSTSLSGNGPNTEVFSQKWDKNHNLTTWSDSEKCDASGAGGNEKLNNDPTSTTVNVEISAKGKGAGGNYIYLLYLVI